MFFSSKIELAGYWTLLYAPVFLLYLPYLSLFIVASVYQQKSKDDKIPAAQRALMDIALIGNLNTKTAENGTKTFFLFGYQVTTKYARIFGTYAIGLWLSILVIFWINFIVKVTDNCNNRIDCFMANRSRIEDCKLIDLNDPIQCYELEFDFINAAGRVGGLIAVNNAFLYGQLAAQMWLKKKFMTSKSQQNKWRLKSLCILLRAIPLIVVLSFFILTILKLIDTIIDKRYDRLPTIINAIFYIFPLVSLSGHSLLMKLKILDEENISDKNSSRMAKFP